MFPILAIGTVVSATAAVIKGVSWLSQQLSAESGTEAPADKATARTAAGQPGSFQAALSAKTAGQELPVADDAGARPEPAREAANRLPPAQVRSPPVRPHPGAVGGPMIAGLHLPASGASLAHDDIQARAQVGMAAYGRLSERHGDHAASGVRS